MNRLLVAIFAAIASVVAMAADEPIVTPTALLDEALSKVKAMSYHSNDIDWPSLETKVRDVAKDAKDEIDLLAAYEALLVGLGDGHSFVNASQEDAATFQNRHGRAFNGGHFYKKSTSAFTTRRQTTVQRLAIGKQHALLLVIPTVEGGGKVAEKYADTVFTHISSDAVNTCAYIVDLRGNVGGNVWPMLAGLSPLLGDGVVSGGVAHDGKMASSIKLTKGVAYEINGSQPANEIIRVAHWRALPGLADKPVAVLIDDAVASSGEGVAVAFKGRANTRFFGQKTLGVATVNDGFDVGHVNLVVMTQLMGDRNGNTYSEGILPDDVVDVAQGKDAVVAARTWLGAQQACVSR